MKAWKEMSVTVRRNTVLKFYNRGLTYSRVAELLGVTTNTIAGVMHRAKGAGREIRVAGFGKKPIAADRPHRIGRPKVLKPKVARESSALTGLPRSNPTPPIPKRELREISLREDGKRTDLILFEDREANQCAWPMSEPTAEMLCCGRTVQKTFKPPYCSEHSARSMSLRASSG